MSGGSISSDMEMLMEEIISLRRERKELLESLTPKISCWRDEISGAASSSFHKMDSSTIKPASSFQSDSQQQQPSAVTDDFDILEDVEDLGQRMLSLSHSLSTSHAPISLYKADELVSTASKLANISLDFLDSTEAAMEEAADEESKMQRMKERMNIRIARGEHDFSEELFEREMIQKVKQTQEMRNDDELSKLFLSHESLKFSSNVLDRPYCYKNELAMLFTVEEEEEYERVMEAEREMERQRQKSKQRRQRDKNKQQIVVKEERVADEQETKSQTEQLKEWMDDELEFFAGHRSTWERSSGSKAGRSGGFESRTTLSPLQFTHCTPGILLPRAAVTERTLQIYSFKLVGLTEQLKWPLRVYGVVAARDTVDRNRNLLFSRSRIKGQLLSGHDSYLRLTGPSRAILVGDYVDFEVELKVRDGDDERNDTQLMCVSKRYEEADGDGEQPLLFDSPFCSAELRFESVPTTVQATILSVRVVGGEFPFSSGGQVACIVAARERVVLFDSTEKITREAEVVLDGYLPLSRNAISVEFEKGVTVEVTAYVDSGSISDRVHFRSKWCNISQDRCFICGSEVEITVAWSRVVRDKMEMLLEGYATQV